MTVVLALAVSGCASNSRTPVGMASGGVQTSQQMEFNKLILKQRVEIKALQDELLLHRRQIARLMQQQARR